MRGPPHAASSAAVPGAVAQRTGSDERRAAPFVVLERFHLAIAIVTVIASSVFLLALMLMLVDERRATVGMLRLIGFRRSRILQHVLRGRRGHRASQARCSAWCFQC